MDRPKSVVKVIRGVHSAILVLAQVLLEGVVDRLFQASPLDNFDVVR